MNIPKEALYIIDTLNKNGYEAYIVGGCVRDSLIGIVPNDWDITTSAVPAIVAGLFEKTIPTGLKFGTITVMINSSSFEVTTFRNVDNSSISLATDLSKRDFTINSIAYHPKIGLVDPFDGQKDLESKIIKCVQNADTRFFEDPLRMLRAIRFAAQLEFTIEEKTYKSIVKNGNLLSKVSSERIREEFNKILLLDSSKLNLIIECELINYIIPEFTECLDVEQDNPYHIYTVSEHMLKSVLYMENDLGLKLTMLLHDIGKPRCKTIDEKGVGHFYGHPEVSQKIALSILKRLKYDNKMIDRVSTLILYHDSQIGENNKSVKKLLSKIGKDYFYDLLKVKLADGKAQNPAYYNDRYQKVKNIEVILEDVLKTNECFNIRDLDISGNELLSMGYSQGREIGEMLKFLLEQVIENPCLNKKENLIEIVKSQYKK